MRKIKRFKITVHHKEISRRIMKAGLDLGPAGIQGEAALWEFITALSSKPEPCVVYDTFDREALALDIIGHEGCKHFSAGAVTLSPSIETALEQIADPAAKHAARIAAFEFFESAVDFVTDLIKEEAAKDDFELGDPVIIQTPAFGENSPLLPSELRFMRKGTIVAPESAEAITPVILENLQASKIGIEMREGRLYPAASVLFSVGWQSKKKTRKK